MDGDYTGAEHCYTINSINTEPAINSRFKLSSQFKEKLNGLVDPLKSNPHRYFTYLRSYSRTINGRKEQWVDTVIRVTEGIMSCYLNHVKKNHLTCRFGSDFAERMALSMFRLEWSPPGRGLYAMGTEKVYHEGSSALINCYACDNQDPVMSAAWTMDMLMNGGGVGFRSYIDLDLLVEPATERFEYRIPDTRQGWISALELLLRAYLLVGGKRSNPVPVFDYSLIRKAGTPLKGSGGTSSGPQPLQQLLNRITVYLETALLQKKLKMKSDPQVFAYLTQQLHERKVYSDREYRIKDELKKAVKLTVQYNKVYDGVRLAADIFNNIGKCVIAGNIRRSAQIAIGDVGDTTFYDLKSLEVNPERKDFMFFSNNSIRMWTDSHFEEAIPKIVERVKVNGEPGIINMINIKKFGRYGNTEYREDPAELINPCGEIPLSSYECCILSTICPVKCLRNKKLDWPRYLETIKYATFYATVVTTIRHSWQVTNQIIARNRRIGVSMSGIAEYYDMFPTKLIETMRISYRYVRQFNRQLTSSLGIPESIRVTTVKPEGKISIIMSVSAGVHFPLCHQGVARVRINRGDPLIELVRKSGYPVEPANEDVNSMVISFPYRSIGRSTKDVSIWEKFSLAIASQKHYSDNAVSFTGDFSKAETTTIDKVAAINISQMKCFSVLPRYDDPYPQLPYQELSDDEYQKMFQSIKEINWENDTIGKTEDSPSESTAFCTDDYCIMPRRKKSSSSSPSSSSPSSTGSKL